MNRLFSRSMGKFFQLSLIFCGTIKDCFEVRPNRRDVIKTFTSVTAHSVIYERKDMNNVNSQKSNNLSGREVALEVD